jgi:hypothetical protein
MGMEIPITNSGFQILVCYQSRMSDEKYLRLDGLTVMFDVQRGGQSIGIVWEDKGQWYADPQSMAAPQICETTREAAADKL